MGSENGQLSFYNEFGYELLVLRFANSPVRQLTLCPKASELDLHRPNGELLILHSLSLISVSEFELRAVLQICSLCLVKDISPAPKKISFSRLLIDHHDQVTGLVPLGVSRPSLYDHLLNRSISCGRFEYSELPEEQINFALAGTNPFFAFHSAPIRRQTSGLFQIASFLTSEAKRAVFGESKSNQGLVRWTSFGVDYRAPSCSWLVGSNSSSTEDTTLRLLHGVADRRRKLDGPLDYSSDRRWAACPDNLGRVVLIDLRKGVAVRFFKILVCYNVAHGSEVLCRRLTDFPARLLKLPLVGSEKPPAGGGLLIVAKSGNFYKLDLGFDLCVTGSSRKLAAHKAHDYRITLEVGKLVEATGNAGHLVDGSQLAGQKLFELIEQFRHAVSLEKCIFRLISERRIAKNPTYVQLLITKVIKTLKRTISDGETTDGLVSGSSEAENSLLLARLKSYLSQVSAFCRFKKLLVQAPSNESVSEETPEALADNLAWDSEDASKCFFVYEVIGREFERGTNVDESSVHVPSLAMYFNSTKLVYLPLRSSDSELSSQSEGLEAPSVRILVSGKTSAKQDHLAELGKCANSFTMD
ncbi:hypothetical protein Ciccas_007570 [Cichlidogyrus casuarinus]|uniref:Rab3-GAP regulatory subunit N-terminal domain-containing protein n=1 Tax=Cichlidogyrus casuarinus TaxID=1844966 RepID=A0ABD2Q2H9_9PLAT